MTARTELPTRYGTGKVPLLRDRLALPWGTSFRTMAPRVFPGIPLPALLGFTVISVDGGHNGEGITEDTGIPSRAYPNGWNYFHEIGPWQTEAGPSLRGALPVAQGGKGYAGGSAESPAPGPSNNNWKLLHDHPEVTALLGGRAATMVPSAWKTAPDDQNAVGLVSIARHGAGVNRALRPALRSTDPHSLWHLALAFTGFSAGDGTAAATLNRYADQLATVPEARRWGAFLEAVATESARVARGPRTRPWTIRGHGNPAYDALRTEQKFRGGRAYADSVHDAATVAWFDTQTPVHDRTAMEEAILVGATPNATIQHDGGVTTAGAPAVPDPEGMTSDREGTDAATARPSRAKYWVLGLLTLLGVGSQTDTGQRVLRKVGY